MIVAGQARDLEANQMSIIAVNGSGQYLQLIAAKSVEQATKQKRVADEFGHPL